jgi:hypothetical protein
VLFVAANYDCARRFLRLIRDQLPETLVESANDRRLCLAGWDKINPTVTATSQSGAVAGLRADLVVVEASDSGCLPLGFNEMFRCRLTAGGRVALFSWDAEPA